MGRTLVFDLEADGLLDTATRVWCGVFKDVHSGEVTSFTHPDKSMLDFMDKASVLICHNCIGYDFPLLRKLYDYEYKGKVIDTLLMSQLQKPDRPRPVGCKSGPHSVEAWGIRFHRYKPEHEDWSQFSPEMLHRCAEDVEIQHRIYDYLRDEGGKEWADAHRMVHKLFEVLNMQEQYGWLVDQDYMHKCIHQLTHWMDRIDTVIGPRLPLRCIKPNKVKGEYTYVKKPFKQDGSYTKQTATWMEDNGYLPSERCVRGPYSRIDWHKVDLGSNAQVKDFLISEGWIPEQWNIKEGQRTSPKLTHGEPFHGITSGVGRLIARRVQCRHRRSQIESWLKTVRPDGRVSQRITGMATTGRLRHAGIVNVPGGDAFFGKQMRKCFIAKPGYKIVGVDSAGCQNRMLAARVDDPEFTEVLINGDKEKGTSIHQINQKAIKKVAKLDVSYKISKNLNYAFMFGAQDPKLASTANVPEKQGAMIRKALLSVSPGLERVVNELTEEWKSTAKKRMKWGKVQYYDGYITGLDGRPILIEKEHTILVYMLQSDEAIMMQYALCFLYKWCTQRGWVHGREYGFVANIHDEYQAEVRDDIVEEFAALGEKAITKAGEYLKIKCLHEGHADIGINWNETH